MKTYCVLNDGETIADKRFMSAQELIQANKDSIAATDGTWSWCIDIRQSGLKEFDVVCANASGDCNTGFTIKGPSSEFIKELYSDAWHFVSVSERQLSAPSVP